MAAALTRAVCTGYTVSPKIFESLPDAKVAVALVEIVVNRRYKGEAKKAIGALRQETVQNFTERYTDPTSWQAASKAVQVWRSVFEDFGAGEDKKCTLEYLFTRVEKAAQIRLKAQNEGKKVPKPDLGKISNIVDVANCVSADFEVPIGVMDFDKLRGSLELRYGETGETFVPLGEDKTYEMQPSHIVLADETKVLSWLWTCKVGRDVIVLPRSDGESSRVLICVDQPAEGAGDAEAALDKLLEVLPAIGGKGVKLGVLSRDNPTLLFESPEGSKDEKK